jgi:hypothetical protein
MNSLSLRERAGVKVSPTKPSVIPAPSFVIPVPFFVIPAQAGTQPRHPSDHQP